MAVAPASVGAGEQPSPLRRAGLKRQLEGWSFSAPFVALFLAFWALPIVASLILSFTDFGISDLRDPLGASFIGLDNYSELVHDDVFWKSVKNTAYFVIVGVPVTIAVGLAIAVGLNHAALKLKGIFRVAYY